jgi:RNA polymerase sigma-70 factor (ECF subfamily)
MVIEAETLLTEASRIGRFGRFQCEAAIQSVHVQRPITGQLNLSALRTLYDLLVEQTGSLGAQIGRAVVLAEEGDPASAAAALDALPTDRVARHQPWWVARARVAALAGNPAKQREFLRHAINVTEDAAMRDFLEDQYLALI